MPTTTTKRKVTFEQWMAAVDSAIARKLGGLTSRDISDCCYHDWYDDGVSPATAATRAIRNEGM